jgi:hypothetical protein
MGITERVRKTKADPATGEVVRAEVESALRACNRFIGSNGGHDASVDLVTRLAEIPLNKKELALVRLLLPAGRQGTTGAKAQRCEDVLLQLENQSKE